MKTENKENKRDLFFENRYDRIFSAKLSWDIRQPFVCGNLLEIARYCNKPNNGIDGIFEIGQYKFRKVSRKELIDIAENTDIPELKDELTKLLKRF